METTALTLQEAAEVLGVSAQRVSQLLDEGKLDGPQSEGDQRATPNAPRVWRASLDAELARRLAKRTNSRKGYEDQSAALEELVAQLRVLADHNRQLLDAVQRLERREEAARSLALNQKAAREVVADALAAEQRRCEDLEVELASTLARLRNLERRSQTQQALASVIDDGLGGYLAPDDLRGLGPGE